MRGCWATACECLLAGMTNGGNPLVHLVRALCCCPITPHGCRHFEAESFCAVLCNLCHTGAQLNLPKRNSLL